MSGRARAWLLNGLRGVVTGGCIAIAAWLIDWSAFGGVLARVDLTMAALIAPGMLLAVFALAWRWRTLLVANGFDTPYSRVLRLTWIGQFFGNFLPGSVGGDVARMVMAAGREDRKAGAAATVFLDRLMGLGAMAVMAAAAVVPLAADPRLRVPVTLAAAPLAALVAGYFLYFNRRLRDSAVGRWVKGRLPEAARDVDAVLASVRRSPRLLVLTMAQSFVAQFSIICVAYGLSRALGVRVGVLPFLLFEVIVFILTAVPVSIGGWGVQEAAYAGLFATVGVPVTEAVALSVLVKLAQVAASLPGGVLFAVGARRDRAMPAPTAPDGSAPIQVDRP